MELNPYAQSYLSSKQTLKDQNLTFEEAFTLADRKNQVEAMTQKALLEQVQVQKQLNELTNQNLESQAKIEKFKSIYIDSKL